MEERLNFTQLLALAEALGSPFGGPRMAPRVRPTPQTDEQYQKAISAAETKRQRRLERNRKHLQTTE